MNAQNVMSMLNDPKNWKKTHKKGYKVWICRPAIGTKCTNVLEGANYVTDQNKQFIISGTVGETWVIDIEKLAKTYTFDTGAPITPDALKSKMNKAGEIDWVKLATKQTGMATNYAFHLPLSVKNFPVQTSLGDTLLANRDGIKHGKGDFLVCADAGGFPNLNDVLVVNGEVFPSTYDLHAFPNMFDAVKSVGDPVRPTKSFIKGSVGNASSASSGNKAKEIASKVAKACIAEGIKIYGGLCHESELIKSYDQFKGSDAYSFDLNGDPDADRSMACIIAGDCGAKLYIVLNGSDYGVHNITSVSDAVRIIRESLTEEECSAGSDKASYEFNAYKLRTALEKVKDKIDISDIQVTIDNDGESYFYRIDVSSKAPDGRFVILNSYAGDGGKEFQVVLMDSSCNEVGRGTKEAYNVTSEDVKQAILDIRSYFASGSKETEVYKTFKRLVSETRSWGDVVKYETDDYICCVQYTRGGNDYSDERIALKYLADIDKIEVEYSDRYNTDYSGKVKSESDLIRAEDGFSSRYVSSIF
jgi:hypothetical protein